MLLSVLEDRIDELVADLATYHGYRTLWLDEGDAIVHAEPDDMLEEHGYRYVATLMAPDRDELTTTLLRLVQVQLDRPTPEALAAWRAPAMIDAALAPA